MLVHTLKGMTSEFLVPYLYLLCLLWERSSLLGFNLEYNSDFSANKGVDTDDKGKPEPLLTLDMVAGSQEAECEVCYLNFQRTSADFR